MASYIAQYSRIIRFWATKEMERLIHEEAERRGLEDPEYLRWLIRREFNIPERESDGWKYIKDE